MKKELLATPGPTPIPKEVSSAMFSEYFHHRTPQFSEILKENIEILKYLYQTRNDIFILTCSGTGAMESAIVNTLSFDDEILVVDGGKFGERWTNIALAYKLKPKIIKLEWGEILDIKIIENELKKNKNIKAIFVQYSETSTGTKYNIEEISKIVNKYNKLMIVDCITALGVMECKTDEWNLDIVISGSQKTYMLPPGLAMLSFSKKAYDYYRKSNLPKFYFDIGKEKKAYDKNFYTAWTPAISLFIGLNKSLKILKEEGLDNLIKRHEILANSVRKAVVSLGLEVFSKNPSDAITAVSVPKSFDIYKGKLLVKIMREKYKVTIAGGQGKYEGKIFRIGHIGYYDIGDMLNVFQSLEMTLKELGHQFEIGISLKILQENYMKYYL